MLALGICISQATAATLNIGQEKPLIVASVKGGAWKSAAGDPSIRTSIKPGDAIRPGERLETFQTNEIQVALDPEGKNLIAIQGSFSFRRNVKGTDIHLDRGRALAVLDGLKNQEKFTITTPIGVATVRGTRFAVNAPLSAMDVKTYKGEVRVQALSAQTERPIGRSVDVKKGYKTHFTADSKELLTVSELSPRDTMEYQEMFKRIRDTQKILRSQGRSWFLSSEEPPRSFSVPAAENSDNGASKTGHAIVF